MVGQRNFLTDGFFPSLRFDKLRGTGRLGRTDFAQSSASLLGKDARWLSGVEASEQAKQLILPSYLAGFSSLRQAQGEPAGSWVDCHDKGMRAVGKLAPFFPADYRDYTF